MKKMVFIAFFTWTLPGFAKEAVVEKPVQSVSEEKTSDAAVSFQDVQPSEKLASIVETPLPVRQPASVTTYVPQRYIDKELNIACYYLVPAPAANPIVGGPQPEQMPGISCVHMGKEEKAKEPGVQ